jgi:hypothetical protein
VHCRPSGEEHSASSDSTIFPGPEGRSSFIKFISNERFLIDTAVGCLEVGGRMLSELCLEATFFVFRSRCSKFRIDDSAFGEEVNLAVGGDNGKY